MITASNVQSLLSAANLLEVLPVRSACCAFMQRHMDETNALGKHGSYPGIFLFHYNFSPEDAFRSDISAVSWGVVSPYGTKTIKK